MGLSNGQLSELLARAADAETGHRARALHRASRSALWWPEETLNFIASGHSLVDLPSIRPWLARIIGPWLEEPPQVVEPPEDRRGFLTLAEVRSTLAAHPGWADGLRADLQMHTTHSDGKASVREMADASAALGYEYAAITDHSKGLPIARGMDEGRLGAEIEEIDTVNADLEASGSGFRLLRSIEMNLSPEGEEDMEREALARLDLVLGTFHSKLRLAEDQTERYLAAVRNPTVNVLAHPRCRMFGRRRGLSAEWPRVLSEVAALDKAVEVDANPYRQDLDVETLKLAREAGVRISIGTDAHSIGELRYMEFGLAAAIRAGIPRERIFNFMPRADVVSWARTSRKL